MVSSIFLRKYSGIKSRPPSRAANNPSKSLLSCLLKSLRIMHSQYKDASLAPSLQYLCGTLIIFASFNPDFNTFLYSKTPLPFPLQKVPLKHIFFTQKFNLVLDFCSLNPSTCKHACSGSMNLASPHQLHGLYRCNDAFLA